MFTTTRELLAKHITPKLVRDMEEAFLAATRNGGKLPIKPEASDGEAGSDSQPPSAEVGSPASEQAPPQDAPPSAEPPVQPTQASPVP
jgi:hypothetical protein